MLILTSHNRRIPYVDTYLKTKEFHIGWSQVEIYFRSGDFHTIWRLPYGLKRLSYTYMTCFCGHNLLTILYSSIFTLLVRVFYTVFNACMLNVLFWETIPLEVLKGIQKNTFDACLPGTSYLSNYTVYATHCQ